MCVSIYTTKCNMQHLNSGVNKLEVDDLTHVKILIIQETWKNSLKNSSVIVKYWITRVLVYYNKCKIKFTINGFNILKVNGSTLIIEEMWKKSLIYSNLNVRF
jgi:hypothetical protein